MADPHLPAMAWTAATAIALTGFVVHRFFAHHSCSGFAFGRHCALAVALAFRGVVVRSYAEMYE